MRDAGEEERKRGSLGDADVPGRPSKEGDALAQPKVGGRLNIQREHSRLIGLCFTVFRETK